MGIPEECRYAFREMTIHHHEIAISGRRFDTAPRGESINAGRICLRIQEDYCNEGKIKTGDDIPVFGGGCSACNGGHCKTRPSP